LADLEAWAKHHGCHVVTDETLADLTKQASRAHRRGVAIRRIFGLLSKRRWWNDNVWAAREIAKESMLDVR
jgi:hypothetical protein